VTELLATLDQAARAGAAVLRDAFAALDRLDVRNKGPADFVSQADLDAEAAIRAVLTAALPDAAWRGEESEYVAGRSSASAPAREWVVDPLDGTTNFLAGIPHFAVSIALREAGETIAGVVYQPITDELFAAVRGAGATLDGAPMRVSTRTSPATGTGAQPRWDRAVLTTGVPHRGSRFHHSFAAELAAVRERVAGIRRFGAAALDLAWVAAGRVDGFWERGLQPWDVAAGNLLVREAGGLVSGLDDDHDPDQGLSVVAASRSFQPELRAVLRSAG
jgi:myo-inositol-1(or 4)-monophosphatase